MRVLIRGRYSRAGNATQQRPTAAHSHSAVGLITSPAFLHAGSLHHSLIPVRPCCSRLDELGRCNIGSDPAAHAACMQAMQLIALS